MITSDATPDDPLDVPPGETRHLRYPICETYLGDPVEVPVSIVNGEGDGPRAFLTAAVHGDELNGVKVLQEVVARFDSTDLHGSLVCVDVVNLPAYLAQQRYLLIYDLYLNRSFPGQPESTTAERMANEVYATFFAPCDLGVDFHTSTRNRTTMYHVRADMRERRGGSARGCVWGQRRHRRARASRRRECARRVRSPPRRRAPRYGLATGAWRRPREAVAPRRRGRAGRDAVGPAPLVRAEEPICAVSDHFRSEEVVIRAPFTGIIVGVLENPVVLLGHPICHLARIDDETHAEIEAEIARGEFDGYSQMGLATSALARRPSEWSSDPGPGGMHARTGRLYQTTRPRASVTWTACLASCPLFIPIRMRA